MDDVSGKIFLEETINPNIQFLRESWVSENNDRGIWCSKNLDVNESCSCNIILQRFSARRSHNQTSNNSLNNEHDPHLAAHDEIAVAGIDVHRLIQDPSTVAVGQHVSNAPSARPLLKISVQETRHEEQDCCGTHMQRVIMTGGIPVRTNLVASEKCDQENDIYCDTL